jgi:hypothetical protein
VGGHDSAPEQAEFGHEDVEGLNASSKLSERIGKCNLGQACATERLFVLSANRLEFHTSCSRIRS